MMLLIFLLHRDVMIPMSSAPFLRDPRRTLPLMPSQLFLFPLSNRSTRNCPFAPGSRISIDVFPEFAIHQVARTVPIV